MTAEVFQERRFLLTAWSVVREIVNCCRTVFATKDEPIWPVEVIFREKKKDRSLAQNRLAFKWHQERGQQTGMSVDEDRRFCKLRYGCPLLLAQDEEFARFYQKAIEPLEYPDRLEAMEYVPVTRLFSVTQMTEYLATIERASAAEAITLTHPDMYNEAMGR